MVRTFFISLFSYWEEGLLAKAVLTASWGALFTIPLYFIEKYLFNDWQFMLFMIIMVFLNFAIKFILTAKTKQLRIDLFFETLRNSALYMTFLMAVHVMSHYKLSDGRPNDFASWIDRFAYSAVMGTQFIEMLYSLGKAKLIKSKSLLSRFADFDDEGKEIK